MSAAVNVHGDFEQSLRMTETRAARLAERIIKRHFDMLEFPKPDQHNVLRHGWNRPIERRAKASKVADFELREDLQGTKLALHPRVAMLMAKAPISDYRLSVMYAIADLLGAQQVRDWEPLWQALERHAWASVMKELLACNWNGLVGTSDRNKELFAELIMGLSSDAMPADLR